METGLLNFHDEETFTHSIYDQVFDSWFKIKHFLDLFLNLIPLFLNLIPHANLLTKLGTFLNQGDLSGVDGQGSLLDMMHSDLQYSSDYINQSAVHWDSDQEQE